MAIVVALAGLVAVLLVVGLREELRQSQAPGSANSVGILVTEVSIVALEPGGEGRLIPWSELNRVVIRTTDQGPYSADMFWEIYTQESSAPAIVLPGDSPGTPELLAAMQARLPRFRNEVVIHAMGSTSNAEFTVWEASTAEPESPAPPNPALQRTRFARR